MYECKLIWHFIEARQIRQIKTRIGDSDYIRYGDTCKFQQRYTTIQKFGSV